MKPRARAAVITKLRDQMEVNGSWAGETHLQKALYFLQEGAGVPLEFNFILYKFGPFSFDLREELGSLRSAGLIDLKAAAPYGPQLIATDSGHELQARFPKTLSRFGDEIDSVADFIGSKGVGELERLGTALMFLSEDSNLDDEEIAKKICDVKPHVDQDQAIGSSRQVREFLESRHQSAA